MFTTNFVSVTKPNELMLYREVITVFQIQTKHTNSHFGQNIKFLMVNYWCVKWPLDLSGSRTAMPQYLHMCELKSLPNFIKLAQMVHHCQKKQLQLHIGKQRWGESEEVWEGRAMAQVVSSLSLQSPGFSPRPFCIKVVRVALGQVSSLHITPCVSHAHPFS